MRFRPNIVVSGSTAYNEDNWKRLNIGEAYFTVSVSFPIRSHCQRRLDYFCAHELSSFAILSSTKAYFTVSVFAGHICRGHYKTDDLVMYSVQCTLILPAKKKHTDSNFAYS